jgi:NTE family protein
MFQKRFLRHRGITIIQKRDPTLIRLHPSKVALVLAGGAVTGGGFKVGGLRALDELFARRRLPGGRNTRFSLTDCDMFVGLSAGGVLASVLAAGISPEEALRIMLGQSSMYDEFTAGQYMAFEPWELIKRVGRMLGQEQEIFTNWLSGATDVESVAPYTLRRTLGKMVQAVAMGLPVGIFSTGGLGRYLARNMDRAGLPDDFEAAHDRTGKDLYLTAVDLNRGEMVVFGHDEPYSGVKISDAVRASCALPGWYRPVRIPNPRAAEPGEHPTLDLLDGGLVRTANVRIAAEKGADLVICYNPFTRIRYEHDARSLADHGPYALASQVFRILLGARLDLAKELIYRDETIDCDVVFIEPAEDDFVFFRMNPLRHSNKEKAALHGYAMIRESIQSNHANLAEIFATHGIECHPQDERAARTPWQGAVVEEGELRESRGTDRRRR